jgi:hypothetical protein
MQKKRNQEEWSGVETIGCVFDNALTARPYETQCLSDFCKFGVAFELLVREACRVAPHADTFVFRRKMPGFPSADMAGGTAIRRESWSHREL